MDKHTAVEVYEVLTTSTGRDLDRCFQYMVSHESHDVD